MRTLNDVIADQIPEYDPNFYPNFYPPNKYDTAFDILHTPEMQAIKEALHEVYHPEKWRTVDGPSALHRKNLAEAGLPESVIDWVLE